MSGMISLLYVDDEPDLLEIGRLFLEETGEIAVGSDEGIFYVWDSMLGHERRWPGWTNEDSLTSLALSFDKAPSEQCDN